MYAIVDIETTGGYAAANGITEIAVYIHDGEKLLQRFETLINPQQNIPSYITALTGISNAMVASAPVFEDVAPQLFELLNDRVFIAHNVNFDYSFVKHQLKAAGFELQVKKLCTVRLGRKVFPGLPSYSLGKLCRSLQIDISNRHRAGGDAEATVKLFEHLLSNGAAPHIDAMLKKSSGEQWLPLHLSKEQINRLPTGPGVYYFHDAKNTIIYVGKAINIKKRVTSHFTQNDPDRKRQNFVRLIHQVTHRSCATELEALVLESTEIKKLWPKYNYSQKQPLQRYGLYQFEDNRGYLRLAIDKKKKNIPVLYSFNLLHEGQVMLKKMIEQFELSDQLCFINKTALDAAGLKKIGNPTSYNEKVITAIQELDNQLPSFALVDTGIKDQERLCLLIERGVFWGMGHIPANTKIPDASVLKDLLTPYRDNDYIRNNIYAYAEAHPDKVHKFLKGDD